VKKEEWNNYELQIKIGVPILSKQKLGQRFVITILAKQLKRCLCLLLARLSFGFFETEIKWSSLFATFWPY